MFATLFHAKAKSGKRQELVDFLTRDSESSRHIEKGTLRFEVLVDPNDKDAFYVCEAYKDDAAFEDRKNEPYQTWEKMIGEWVGREQLTHIFQH
jgi:autoinducer 2-degrading protein